jgi:hypothetical protein
MKKAQNMPLILLAVSISIFPHVVKASTTAPMMASVRVMPVLSKTVISQAGSIHITTEDITRGYVDVKGGTLLEVRTNSENGYLLSFESESGPYREIWVIDGTRTTVLTGKGGFIHQPYPGRTIAEKKELSYRFLLSRDAVPGSYLWPLRVDVVIN